MFGLFESAPKLYEDLGGNEFKTKYTSTTGAVLLDVRSPGEFKGESIKGARNIDMMAPSFASIIETLDKKKPYFLYCRSGNRSGNACTMMAKNGFKVYNLKRGIGDWPA